MPILVHLTPEKNLRRIIRNGIKDARGVFCMPVLPNYYIAHQWLRELKRGGQRAIVAVYFRVPDDEAVLVGHYGTPHEGVTASQAVKVIADAADAQGYEIIVLRAIGPREIVKVRRPSQVIGWRFYPAAHDRRPCGCSYCARGQIKSRKRQDEYNKSEREARTYEELLADLRVLVGETAENADGETAEAIRRRVPGPDDYAVVSLIYSIGDRESGLASDLAFLLDHPRDDVVEALAFVLAGYRRRGKRKVTRDLLLRLCEHSNAAVREEAAQSLLRVMRDDALPYLERFADDPAIAAVVTEYRAERAEELSILP